MLIPKYITLQFKAFCTNCDNKCIVRKSSFRDKNNFHFDNLPYVCKHYVFTHQKSNFYYD